MVEMLTILEDLGRNIYIVPVIYPFDNYSGNEFTQKFKISKQKRGMFKKV